MIMLRKHMQVYMKLEKMNHLPPSVMQLQMQRLK